MRTASAIAACLAIGIGTTFAAHADDGITAAQPKLPTQTLTITGKDGGKHVFDVERATTPREQQVGEMFRPSIPPDGGMLFIWPDIRVAQMWMEHCPVPEDMVFIAPDGTIDSIAENTVPDSLAIVTSQNPVLATLELQGGTTAKLGIVVGDKVRSKGLP